MGLRFRPTVWNVTICRTDNATGGAAVRVKYMRNE